MKKPLDKTQAGGKKTGLSIVLEGSNPKIIDELSKLVANELSKKGRKTVLEGALRNYEENVLVANQYLLDTTSAPLSPETLSLMVVIKLRERLKKAQTAKSSGNFVISNTSWLGDAYYYELRGKKDVSSQIIKDCSFMKPDVWAVIDDKNGIYTRLAKQVGVSVMSTNLTTQQMLAKVLELVKKTKKVLPVAPIEQKQSTQNSQQLSYLAATRALIDPRNNISIKPLSDIKLAYYRPKNFGNKVLGAYDLINKKLLDNHTQAIADLSKYFATQALRNQKPFKVDVLKRKATDLCIGLLPVSTLVTLETASSQNFEELSSDSKKNSQKIDKLFPNIDAEQPKPQVNLISHAPRNEFEVLESIIFEQSNQGTTTIKKLIDDQNYEQKSELFKSLLNDLNDTGDFLNISYGFDVVGEFSQLYNLLKITSVNNVVFQNLTPRYGYDIPKEVEEAGLAGIFEQSFDLSLELYSLLQAAGFEDQAQYAVLLGHRIRYRFNLNYKQTRIIISRNLKKVSADIKQLVTDVHPLLWS